MEKNGNLYIYAAQPGPAKLEFQPAASSAAVSIDLTLNDVALEPASTKYGRQAFRLPLNRGFNYLRLNTRPTQEIEVKQITIEDAGL
jgi:hypothetical protein